MFIIFPGKAIPFYDKIVKPYQGLINVKSL